MTQQPINNLREREKNEKVIKIKFNNILTSTCPFLKAARRGVIPRWSVAYETTHMTIT